VVRYLCLICHANRRNSRWGQLDKQDCREIDEALGFKFNKVLEKCRELILTLMSRDLTQIKLQIHQWTPSDNSKAEKRDIMIEDQSESALEHLHDLSEEKRLLCVWST